MPDVPILRGIICHNQCISADAARQRRYTCLEQTLAKTHFTIGSGPSCDMVISHPETEDDYSDGDSLAYINLHHAIFYYDPDSESLELYNKSLSTFLAYTCTKGSPKITISTGNLHQLYTGCWHLNFGKGLDFSLYVPHYEHDSNQLLSTISPLLLATCWFPDSAILSQGLQTPKSRPNLGEPCVPSSQQNKDNKEISKRPLDRTIKLPLKGVLRDPIGGARTQCNHSAIKAEKCYSLPRAPQIIGKTKRTLVKLQIGKDGIMVAVKTCRNPSIMEASKTFTIERDILSKLDHPNIVGLLYSNAVDLSLELEYVGQDLHSSIKQRHLPTTLKRRILLDTASGLQYLHGKGLSHNDVKPENILLSPDRAVLCDFELCASMNSFCNGGTPCYLPPEYLAYGERGAGGDIFALGVVMLYLWDVILKPQGEWKIACLHQRDGKGAGDKARKLMREWLRYLRDLEIAPEFGLIQQMLKPNPHERITADSLVSQMKVPGQLMPLGA